MQGILWRAAALLLLPLLTQACDQAGILAPLVLPAGAVPFDAPAVYARWWADVEACSGRAGDLQRVSWFVVPNAKWFTIRGVAYDGYWFEYHHEIVLAAAHIEDSLVVRHEMLHDLLNDGQHPREYFVERCGAILGVARGSVDTRPTRHPLH